LPSEPIKDIQMRFQLLSVLCLLIVQSLLGQNRTGRLPITVSTYTVQYTIEQKLVNGKRETTYRLEKKGTSPGPQLLKWALPVLRNGMEIDFPIVMEIPAGNRVQVVERKLNPGDQLQKEVGVEEIRPISVVLPGLKDFKARLDHQGDYILQGEEIRLYVEKVKEFEQIEWVWSNADKGESIRVTADRKQVFSVFGRYRGTSFKTQVHSVAVDVKRAKDLVDFEITGPIAPVDDTASVRLSLQVKRNVFGEDIRWKWMDEQGRQLQSNGENCTITGNPLLITGKVTVCPIADGRAFGCATFQIPVKRLPGPPSFTVQHPTTLYTDESALLKVVPSVRYPQLHWTWIVNGQLLKSTADSIRLQPLPGMRIEVYPMLNKRGGPALAKTIRFNKVVVRTTLPRSIKGTFQFCGVPALTQEYQLVGAVLGSESRQWVLYENNNIIQRFTGNRFTLKPKRSAAYVVAPDNRPELKYAFRIDVVDLPKVKPAISGPVERCAGEAFTLELNGIPSDEAYQWRWSRAYENGSKGLDSIGSSIRIEESLRVSARYSVRVRYKGCTLPVIIAHQVTLPGLPAKPIAEYAFLNRAKDRIKLEVRGYQIGNQYQWSKDNFETILADKSRVPSYRLKSGTNTLYVRYTDRCGQLSEVSEISVKGPKRDYFFVNAGMNGLEGPANRSFQLTMGNRFWYVRGKGSLPGLISSLYPTELAGRVLEITDDSRVLNYPSSTGTFYEVNGKQQVARMAVTTGFMAGSRSVRAYIGGGFGRADQLWGLDVKDYAGADKVKNYWAINRSLSAAGPEIEGGLFFKLDRINLMAGGSMIYDRRLDKPFMEVSIGVGFSTR
jgi:hypothetical protein